MTTEWVIREPFILKNDAEYNKDVGYRCKIKMRRPISNIRASDNPSMKI
jgi:hypothetical protein